MPSPSLIASAFRSVALLAALASTLVACDGSSDGGGAPAERGPDDDAVEPDGNGDGGERVAGENYRTIDCGELSHPTLATEAVGVFAASDGTRVECALVTVPADWSEPDGDTIELAVYRVPSRVADPAPDPLVYLEGGPGGAGVAMLPGFVSGDAAYLRERSDVLVIDQRGTGYSRPALYCPEALAAEEAGRERTAALRACHDRLVVAGVDFADYTSANGARDLDAVREALGHARWNLYGLSYGTRLALTAMRDAPDAIRGAVLDSVFPLEVSGPAESAYRDFWAIERIGVNCASDASCAGRFDDILTPIDQGLGRLEANPLAGLDAAGYVELLRSEIANPRLPDLIAAVASGSEAEIDAGLDAVAEREEDSPRGGATLPTALELSPPFHPFLLDLADGLFAAVICAEEHPFSATHASPDLAASFPETTRRIVLGRADDDETETLCSIFEVPPADPIEIEPVQAATPTLVLAGAADWQTPPVWSRLASESLPNATYVEFTGLDHGLLGRNACVNAITRAFLDAPEAPLERGCLVDLPGVDYD